MYVCCCNPFTDKDVHSALQNERVKKTTAHVYKEASGGKNPNCGTCLYLIKDMMKTA